MSGGVERRPRAGYVVRIALAVLVTLATVVLVNRTTGWQGARNIVSIAPSMLLPAILLTLSSHFLRGLRLWRVYARRGAPPFVSVLKISLLHNTASFLLPMRLGELVLPVLSRRNLDIGYVVSVSTLLLVRGADVHVLLMAVLVVVSVTGAPFGWLLAGMALLLPIVGAAFARLPAVAGRLPADVAVLVRDRLLLVETWCLTVVIWGVKLAAYLIITVSLYKLDVGRLMLGAIAADASGIFPVSGIAGAGTFEGAFVGAVMAAGSEMSGPALLSAAIALHLYVILINLVAGFIGIMLRFASPPAETGITENT
ncbi:MAG: flippase-like domain-containing protein [Pseudomonadales bacterium]|nr:flippase-like domain-containing protein [Pseudomonadales bacterium]